MFTAKVKCTRLITTGEGDARQASVTFEADYVDNEGRNKEWSKHTPHLTVNMTLNGAAADLVKVDGHYTLTFSEDE